MSNERSSYRRFIVSPEDSRNTLGLYAVGAEDILSELIKLRIASGSSQNALAPAIGISQAGLSELESVRNPKIGTLFRYAAAVGCRIALIDSEHFEILAAGAGIIPVLAGIREASELTQSQIAARMGISQSPVAELERGVRMGRVKDITIKTLTRYIKAVDSELEVALVDQRKI